MGARPLLAGLVAAAALSATPAAHAADPGRWKLAKARAIPIAYSQGVTAAGSTAFAFSSNQIIFSTARTLEQRRENTQILPTDVVSAEGYDHIGDLTYDRAEGGRLLLPLECYRFDAPNGGNHCGTGSIGVASPTTLDWRYYVKLDPRDIKKAMWAEISPDGRSLWTQAGRDLLRYRTADVTAQQTAPIRPVQTLKGAASLGQYTGAAFHRGRLLAAVGRRNSLQVWSIDVRTGRKRLEISRRILGESEGLAVVGRRLAWTIMPAAQGGRTPTYGAGRGAMVTLSPAPARAGARR